MDLPDIMKNLKIQNSEAPNNLFKSVSAEIDDVTTDIVIAECSDKVFLVVSQYQKMGSMLMVVRDRINGPHGIEDVYSTKVVFGDSGEEHQAAARFLAETVDILSKPLCIFINLRSYDIETLKACRDIILDFKKEDTECQQ